MGQGRAGGGIMGSGCYSELKESSSKGYEGPY